MLRRLAWYEVLGMAGFAVGCGRVSLEEPGSDGGQSPDARQSLDARPSGPLDPSLIAWYPLDDVGDGFTVDATGNGHDALCVPAGRCPTLVEGQVDQAMAFDRVRHLRVSNEDRFFNTLDGFTIAAWVWVEEPFVSAPLGKLLGTRRNNSWQFEYEADGSPAFTTANSDGQDVHPAPLTVDEGAWVHLAGSWDSVTKRFYVDGEIQYAVPYIVAFDDSDILIGGDENDGEPSFMLGGRMDDVRIYDRALDDEEIAALAAR